RIRDLARRRIFHINKEGFTSAFKDASFDFFTQEMCHKAFEASGLIALNAQRSKNTSSFVVLDRLEVRLRTPPASPLQDTLSKTLSNTLEFGS
ncbi:hypothetical protein EJ02DRAFT_296234, partial [Clathrospora elynae]